MAKVPSLGKMKDKYGEKGFNIFAITNEAEAKIGGFVTQKKVNYFVGVNKDIGNIYSVTGYPTLFVIDPDGKVISKAHGMPSDSDIDKWIKNVLPKKITREMDKALQSATKAFNKAEYGKAYASAQAVLEGEEVSDAQKLDAEYIIDLVDKHKAASLKRIEAQEEKREYTELFDLLDESAKKFKGHAFAEELQKKGKELKADKTVKKELKHLKSFYKLREKLEKAKSDKKKDGVRKSLEKFAEKNEGTKAAELAQALLGK